MNERLLPLDLKLIRVYPLSQRQSLSPIDKLLVDPAAPPPPCSGLNSKLGDQCTAAVVGARRRQAAVMLLSGAHLIKNGALGIVNRLLEGGWITHLATN